MDKFTQYYSAILAVLVIGLLAWFLYESPDVSKLNALLSDDKELAAYPYRFRVVKLESGVATMSSPRSSDFPAYRALVILYPELTGLSPDSPTMVDAQREMARVQGMAKKTVAGSGDVDRVIWLLDESWLRSNGVYPDQL